MIVKGRESKDIQRGSCLRGCKRVQVQENRDIFSIFFIGIFGRMVRTTSCCCGISRRHSPSRTLTPSKVWLMPLPAYPGSSTWSSLTISLYFTHAFSTYYIFPFHLNVIPDVSVCRRRAWGSATSSLLRLF